MAREPKSDNLNLVLLTVDNDVALRYEPPFSFALLRKHIEVDPPRSVCEKRHYDANNPADFTT